MRSIAETSSRIVFAHARFSASVFSGIATLAPRVHELAAKSR
jgi:hypothetical protein